MDPVILKVLIILIATIIMLVTEIIRIDVAAILCMLALGWSGILTTSETLSGFSSNAVIAMMAVMIMGQGITQTGIMDRFAKMVLQKIGNSRSRIIGIMSLAVGLLSGFIQNIGAAALFLPGILNISRREKIPASALIMPIGFAAILGGTLTMVGSGPLILINDLLRTADMQAYSLFSVTPVGFTLLISGVLFFFLFGKYVMPSATADTSHVSEQEKLIQALHLPNQIHYYTIPNASPLIGKTTEESDIWDRYHLNILGLCWQQDVEYAPWRGQLFEAGQNLALLGDEAASKQFAADFGLIAGRRSPQFAGLDDPEHAGFAEVIIPPRSELTGQSIRHFALRKKYAVEPVILFSKGEEIRGDFSDHTILSGDTLIIYGPWENIIELKNNSDFVVATAFDTEKKDTSKAWIATLCFLSAVALAIAGAPLSMAFFTGAVAMVLTRVLNIQDAYQAVEWKVVFLLAGLIPLGVAMHKTGTAAFLAEHVMSLVQGAHPIFLILAVALLSTLFSLFMSNVGAIVVLAPLVISMAQIGGIDPRPLALMAAVCTANSFILPTHQVNALMGSAGGYRTIDYIKAGGFMTLIFLVIIVSVFYFFYV